MNGLNNAKEQVGDVVGRVRRSGKKKGATTSPVKRRPVKDRWYYDRVEDIEERAYLSKSIRPTDRNGESDIDETIDDEFTTALISDSKVSLSPDIPSDLAELGELDVVSKTVIDLIKSNETGACALQGLLFMMMDSVGVVLLDGGSRVARLLCSIRR